MLRRSGNAAACALLLLASCVSNQGPLPEAPQLVEAAEAQVQAGDYAAALDTLDPVLGEGCPARLLEILLDDLDDFGTRDHGRSGLPRYMPQGLYM